MLQYLILVHTSSSVHTFLHNIPYRSVAPNEYVYVHQHSSLCYKNLVFSSFTDFQTDFSHAHKTKVNYRSNARATQEYYAPKTLKREKIFTRYSKNEIRI